MHCISSLKLVSMAVGLGLSGVGLVDESVETNLGEFIYVQNVALYFFSFSGQMFRPLMWTQHICMKV